MKKGDLVLVLLLKNEIADPGDSFSSAGNSSVVVTDLYAHTDSAHYRILHDYIAQF